MKELLEIESGKEEIKTQEQLTAETKAELEAVERDKERMQRELQGISNTLHDLTAKYQNRYLFFIVKRPITIETIPHIVNQVLMNFTDFENATIKALREKNLNVIKYTDELAKNLEKAVKQINGLCVLLWSLHLIS